MAAAAGAPMLWARTLLNPMLTTPIEQLTLPGTRFAREPGVTGMGRRYELEGDARPGDVLALAGGALVYDANGNGMVDGHDAVLPDQGRRFGTLVDLRA